MGETLNQYQWLFSFLGGALGGTVTAVLHHYLAGRKARNDRRIDVLKQRLADARAGLNTFDHYLNEPYDMSEHEVDDLMRALAVFGEKAAEEGAGLFFRKDQTWDVARARIQEYRERMQQRIRAIEWELGHPEIVDIGNKSIHRS